LDSYKTNKWKRIQDVYPNNTLWGTKGVRPDDLQQGSIGDCWFVAACAAVAEVPSRIQKMFLTDHTNQGHVFAATIWPLGMPQTVVVDDNILFWSSWNSPVFGNVDDDNGLWGPMIEKIAAKTMGSYEHIVGGWFSEGVRLLTGAPGEMFYNSNFTEDTLFDKIESWDKEGFIMGCSTAGSGND
jgi:hypothetical protein